MSRDCTDAIVYLCHTDVQSLLTLRYPIQMSQYADPKIFTEFSEPERSYAISQVDPFHDYPYRVTGAPSDYDSPTVLLTMNQEMTISADKFGLSTAEGSKWDFHVTILPLLQKAAFYSARLASSSLLFTGGSSDESPWLNLFPISVHASNNGGKTYIYDAGYPPVLGPESNVVGYFSNPSSDIQVPRIIRVAAISFEVIDETPKYYQQGSVTCYMAPGFNQIANIGLQATAAGTATTSSFLQTTTVSNGPPNSLAQATIIPGSKTWKASEGAYVVGRRFDESNPFKRPLVSDIVLYSPNDPDNPLLKNSFFGRELFNARSSQGVYGNYDSFNSPIPYHVTGAYFTGVSGQFGTYRLRTKITYEISPDPLDTTLVPLSMPPLKRNFAFEYKLALLLSEMDNFCPQSMNPKGEWWKSAIGIYKRVSNGIDKVLTSPVAVGLASKAGPEALAMFKVAQEISGQNKAISKVVSRYAGLDEKGNRIKKPKKEGNSEKKSNGPK